MRVEILERFRFQMHGGPECQCENSFCIHGKTSCIDRATMQATVHCPAYGPQTMQLCEQCALNYSQSNAYDDKAWEQAKRELLEQYDGDVLPKEFFSLVARRAQEIKEAQ